MFCTSGKEMGALTGNGMHDSAWDLTEMASMQFAVYGLMNPYTYQRPKITPLPNIRQRCRAWHSRLCREGGSGIETSYGESSRNISELLENRPELIGTNREKLLSMVQDTKLAAYINEVYRPGASVGKR